MPKEGIGKIPDDQIESAINFYTKKSRNHQKPEKSFLSIEEKYLNIEELLRNEIESRTLLDVIQRGEEDEIVENLDIILDALTEMCRLETYDEDLYILMKSMETYIGEIITVYQNTMMFSDEDALLQDLKMAYHDLSLWLDKNKI